MKQGKEDQITYVTFKETSEFKVNSGNSSAYWVENNWNSNIKKNIKELEQDPKISNIDISSMVLIRNTENRYDKAFSTYRQEFNDYFNNLIELDDINPLNGEQHYIFLTGYKFKYALDGSFIFDSGKKLRQGSKIRNWIYI